MVNDMDDFLHGTPGDAERGIAAFKKVCAQCHKLYGEGAEVGPDISRNGRNNWEQLLHNQSALVLRSRLRMRPNTVVTAVPIHIYDQAVERY